MCVFTAESGTPHVLCIHIINHAGFLKFLCEVLKTLSANVAMLMESPEAYFIGDVTVHVYKQECNSRDACIPTQLNIKFYPYYSLYLYIL